MKVVQLKGYKKKVKLPCIKKCVADLNTQVCYNCGITIEQYRNWSTYTNEQRNAIITNLNEERKRINE